MACMSGCGDAEPKTVIIPGDGSPIKKGGVCIRCFTFWVLVLLLAIGVAFHSSSAKVNRG